MRKRASNGSNAFVKENHPTKGKFFSEKTIGIHGGIKLSLNK